MNLEQSRYTRTSVQKSRPNRLVGPSHEIERALNKSTALIREEEMREFSRDGNSRLGLKLAALRTEMTRLKAGLPIRLDSVLRAVGGGELYPVPVRDERKSSAAA